MSQNTQLSLKERVFGQRVEQVKEALNPLKEAGMKFSLDFRNAAQTEMELDVLDAIEDPGNDAIFKVRKLNRLIILTYKYAAVAENPRIARKVIAWNKFYRIWKAIVNGVRQEFGNYATVVMQVPYFDERGMISIRDDKLSLSPKVFTHQWFRYLHPESSWQRQIREAVALQTYGNKTDYAKVPALTFTPLSESLQSKQIHSTQEEEQKEREIYEGIEYLYDVEVEIAAFTLYAFLHREKHTFPNTTIVTPPTQMQQGPQPGMIIPTSELIRPRQGRAPGMTQ